MRFNTRRGVLPSWVAAGCNYGGGCGHCGLGFPDGGGEGEGTNAYSTNVDGENGDGDGGDETLETLELYLDVYGHHADKILSELEAFSVFML